MRSSVARCSMYLTYLSHTSSARMPLSPSLNPNPKIAFPSLPCRRRSSCLYLCSIRLTTLRATPNTRRCALACSRQQSNARAVHLQRSTARVPHARAERLTATGLKRKARALSSSRPLCPSRAGTHQHRQGPLPAGLVASPRISVAHPAPLRLHLCSVRRATVLATRRIF